VFRGTGSTATTNTSSEMQNTGTEWEVEGIISAAESVSALIKVIESKGIQHSGTFWTWENKVCQTSTRARNRV